MRNSVRRTSAVAAAAVATLLVFGSGVANADTPAPSSTSGMHLIGQAKTSIPAPQPKNVKIQAAGGNCGYTTSCTSLSNGVLTVNLYGAGAGAPPYSVGVSYEKTGGGTITADFEYNAGSGVQMDQGSFQQSAGQTKGFTWDNQWFDACSQVVGILAVQGQGNFQTPPIYMC